MLMPDTPPDTSSPSHMSTPTQGAAPGKRSGRFSYRGVRRARAHEDAHSAEQPVLPPQDLPDHPLISRGAPQLITAQPALTELINHCRSVGTFAYDSEFIGELTYHPKLCVVQVATPKVLAIIDPLNPEIDLLPFWELLCDGSVEKVVHAGAQDLEPVVRLTGRGPVNVFDTQVAAGFAAMAYPVSLSRLVQHLTGARLGKALTFTDWSKRPLSAVQIRYAADDVRYLPAVRAELGKTIARLGHEAPAREEFEALCDPSKYRFDPDVQLSRVRGSGSLTGPQLGVLRELVIWRDKAARQHDVPPRAFLKDEVLAELARSQPKTVDRVGKIKHLPKPVEIEHGQEILETIRHAQAHPGPAVMPQRAVDPTPTQRFDADALWALAQTVCAAAGIDPNLAADRHEVADLLRHLQGHDQAAVAASRLMSGWRKDLLGVPLQEFLAGRREVGLRWDAGLRSTRG